MVFAVPDLSGLFAVPDLSGLSMVKINRHRGVSRVGVALNGIDRPAGDIDPFEDTSRARRRQSVPEPQLVLSGKSALEDIARRIELTALSDRLARQRNA